MSRHTHPSNRLVLLLALAVVAILAIPALAGVSLERMPIPSGAPTQPTQERSATERQAALLAHAQDAGSVPVIVELQTRLEPEVSLPGPAAIANQRTRLATMQNRVFDRLPIAQGREDVAGLKRFHLYPGFALQATPDLLRALLADPDVEAVHEDRLHAPLLFESVPLIGGDAGGTFGGYTGNGQVVAILDTGVDKNHPFLSGKVVAEACFSTTLMNSGSSSSSTSLCPGGVQESTAPDSGLDCDPSIDGCGHGTHVAGIAAGAGTSFSGVARNAKLIAVQVFSEFSGPICLNDPCAMAYTSDLIKGLEFVFGLRNTHEIASVNLSLGTGAHTDACPLTPPQPPIVNLKLAKIATVVASGNTAYTNAISSPACVPEAVSVGSSDKQDNVSWFSNSAYFLDLLAPGQMIQSSTPGNNYGYMSGTSMAAPHVAGAWAVIREARPEASVDAVLTALKDTGVLITDTRHGTDNRLIPRIRPGLAIRERSGGAESDSPTEIANRESIGDLSDAQGGVDYYYIETPAGATDLEIRIFGGSGDTDLYLRRGSLPTLTEYDCRPYLNGNDETCVIESPHAGTWYIILHGFDSYDGVTVSASYTTQSVCEHEDHAEIGGTLSGLQAITACRTITSADAGLTITKTGDARLTAGEHITLKPGFRVQSGGTFNASIDPALAP